ncbi:MAG: Crp/Fnr family transcriptional regulator [Cytophagales bacterium]|nr:Crp/Fnr family transcriptional regulator [Cytophagales bacterium]
MTPLNALTDEIERLQLWERTKSLKRNEFLKHGTGIDTNLYFVVSGTLRIFVIDQEEELTIRFGYKGNIIAALDSHISGQASDLYIQALKETQLNVISKSTFQQFVQSDPKYQAIWQQLLEQFVYQQMERERDILISSPTERYKRVLKRSPQLFQEIPHKYIASYLRMTPETLSRIKKS